jgi:hypothetical protein
VLITYKRSLKGVAMADQPAPLGFDRGATHADGQRRPASRR